MIDKNVKKPSKYKEVKSLSQFLFSYLRDCGVKFCFGVPGDYILSLFKALEETPGIEAVVSTHEPGAAFSADAYGRISGLGVLMVTYGVGGFNAMNGVACAYAESSPLLVISGGFPTGTYGGDNKNLFTPDAHHFVKHFASQRNAYRNITDLDLRIESGDTAAHTIIRAVTHAFKTKLPVYLEIPTDLMNAQIPLPDRIEELKHEDSEIEMDVVERAVSLFIERIETAHYPVILTGVEIGRYGLQDEILHMMKARNIPIATTILAKGTFDESREGILGVYAGVISQSTETRKIVEKSDLVIMLGVKVTDVNCGIFTAELKREKILIAKSGWIGDGYMRISNEIPFPTFITHLSKKIIPVNHEPTWPDIPQPGLGFSDILIDRYFGVINRFLDGSNVVIADTGDSCYGSLFMTIRRKNGYIAPTFYNTMGFAVPAALGVQLADPRCRPVVLVGDGAFQMTGFELSVIAKWSLNPIVIIFNNKGYGMQRIFVDGPFNDIKEWDYTRIVDLLGGGKAWKVSTAAEMEDALKNAIKNKPGFSLIEAVLPKKEVSTGLQLMGKALTREKKGICPFNVDNKSCSHQHHCSFCRATIWK